MSARPSTRAISGTMLAAAALTIALRQPQLLAAPRLWAEEGEIYIGAALADGGRALLSPQLGYFSLVANLGAWLASLVALPDAAVVTTWVSAIVQLVPIALVAFVPNPLWDRPIPKATLIAALVLLPDGELHLNTINAQFHLAVAAGLLLIASPLAEARSGWRAPLILCAGLGSPQACFLLPAFVWRAWGTRARFAVREAAALALAFAVQVGAALTQGAGARLAPTEPVGVMIKNHLLGFWVHPFLHTDLRYAGIVRETHPRLFLALAFCVLALLALALASGWRADGWRRWGIAGIVLVAVLSTLTSLQMAGGVRYAFASHALIAALLVDRASGGQPLVRGAAIVLLAALLVASAATFRPRMAMVYQPGWSSWGQEAEAARAERRSSVPVWPYGGSRAWSVSLPVAP